MKKIYYKALAVVIAVASITAAYGIGFWCGDNERESQNPIIKYAKAENYKVVRYKEGLITKRETAEKIGDTVLAANSGKDKDKDPVRVYYDEKYKYWRIDGSAVEGRSNSVYCVLINVDGQFGKTTGDDKKTIIQKK